MTSRPFLTSGRRLQRGLVITGAFLITCAAVEAAEWKLDFSPGKAQPGYTRVAPQTAYDARRGFGFLKSPAATRRKPAVFAADVEEGNYDVTGTRGDPRKPAEWCRGEASGKLKFGSPH